MKVRARQLGIEVLEPTRPAEEAFRSRLAELAPDCCPVVAYGALVPPEVLAIPRAGWVNLHFSLLPAWRGAAPVQHALLAGDELTGASTFRLDEGLDTGPVFGTVTTETHPRETAGALLARLAELGAGLLVATLDGIEAGTLSAHPQPADGVSFAPKLGTEDARVRWGDPAVAVDRRVRACTPAPGAWTTFRGRRLKIGPVEPVVAVVAATAPPARARLLPGELLEAGRLGILVGTATDPVRLGELRPEGKPTMPAEAWARGVRLAAGERLG